jgi:hypothetical protein
MLRTEPGMDIVFRAVQSAKAFEEITLQPSLMVTSVSALQPSNKLSPIVETLLPMTALDNLEQPTKQDWPISETVWEH